jgi:GMP reductase
MKISTEELLDFDDVLIKPKRSIAASRAGVVVERPFKFYHSPREWVGLPVMAANMSVTGTPNMGKALTNHRAITCLHKFHKTQSVFNLSYIWQSTGMTDSDTLLSYLQSDYWQKEKIQPNLCVDVANGYTDKFCDAVKKYRERFPESIIMAGNVATSEMVMQLILAGADIVKIGIGPGKACQTRMVAGVGIPQLSAIIECEDTAHGLKSGDKRNGLVCADGGIATPGDICKAFGAGADFVMLGSMLAGTDECDGEWEGSFENKKLKYYGMASYEAQNNHYGKSAEYRATEGKILYAPYKGPVSTIIKEVVGGVRSCCAYTGASSLKDLSKCTSFVRVNRVHRTPSWEIN